MEFKNVIKNRYSSRSYYKKKVERDKLLDILEAARLAPSCANRQNWFFVVLENDNKQKIALFLEEYMKKAKKLIKSYNDSEIKYDAPLSVLDSIRIIREAPVLILAFYKNDDQWVYGDYLSMGCAIEHMALQACDLGLGSLWVRDIIYVKDKIEDLFSFDNMMLVSGLVIGYSKDEKYRAKKKSLDEIMMFYD